MPTAQATGRVCLGDGTDLGHAPAAFGMVAKKGTGITRGPERAEGSQGPPATLQDPQNTIPLGRKMLPQGLQPCDSQTGLPAPNNSAFALAVCWHLPLPLFTQEGELQGAQSLTAGQAMGWEEQGHSPTQGLHGFTVPRFDIFPPGTSQDLYVPLCWVMLLLSCLSSLWMHPPRAEQAGISLGAGRGRIPECQTCRAWKGSSGPQSCAHSDTSHL